jgi:transcription elongation GreA/GreB family factor
LSRAFVREIDDAPPPLPLERPVSAAANLVTPRGARLIEQEIAALEAALMDPAAADEAALRRDLRYWLSRRATAQVVVHHPKPRAAGIGTRVTIRRGVLMSDIWIVGEDEADPAHGRIAWTAPLARALDGAERGEVVELQAGGRIEEIRVFAIAAGGA